VRKNRSIFLKTGLHTLQVAICLSVTLGSLSTTAVAENILLRDQQHLTERSRYGASETKPTLRFTPVTMKDGSRLTLISPSHWSDVADQISQELTRTHQQLTTLFGTIPPFRSSVRLLDEAAFYELTGAPAWTNAMFFRGEIIIPLSTSEPIDLDNLHRSVKHEYSHAVFSALSGGLIPGWIDEGLAQWIEGEENPALRNSLRTYLLKSDPVPMSLLQGGFTKLTPKLVPAAYAQSLIAVQALLKASGVESISEFLGLLRSGVSKDEAFQGTFGITEAQFESRLHDTLRAWSGTTRLPPARPSVVSATLPTTRDRAIPAAR